MDANWCLVCEKHTLGGVYCSDLCRQIDSARCFQLKKKTQAVEGWMTTSTGSSEDSSSSSRPRSTLKLTQLLQRRTQIASPSSFSSSSSSFLGSSPDESNLKKDPMNWFPNTSSVQPAHAPAVLPEESESQGHPLERKRKALSEISFFIMDGDEEDDGEETHLQKLTPFPLQQLRLDSNPPNSASFSGSPTLHGSNSNQIHTKIAARMPSPGKPRHGTDSKPGFTAITSQPSQRMNSTHAGDINPIPLGKPTAARASACSPASHAAPMSPPLSPPRWDTYGQLKRVENHSNFNVGGGQGAECQRRLLIPNAGQRFPPTEPAPSSAQKQSSGPPVALGLAGLSNVPLLPNGAAQVPTFPALSSRRRPSIPFTLNVYSSHPASSQAASTWATTATSGGLPTPNEIVKDPFFTVPSISNNPGWASVGLESRGSHGLRSPSGCSTVGSSSFNLPCGTRCHDPNTIPTAPSLYSPTAFVAPLLLR
jgi:hypothetical protein